MQMTRSTNYQTHLNGKLKTIQHCEQVKPGNMPDTMHVTNVNMNMGNTVLLLLLFTLPGSVNTKHPPD